MTLSKYLREQRKAATRLGEAVAHGKALLLYSSLFDLLFLFLAGTVNRVIVKKLTTLMYVIGGLLASLGISQPSVTGLVGQAGAWKYVTQFGILFLIWIGGLYFLYCLFHGLAWRLAHAMLGKPKPLVPFASRFFRVNIPWYLLFVLLNAMLFVVSYVSVSIAKRAEVSVHPLWYVPYILLFYVALVSYGTDSAKSRMTFRLAWTHRWRLLPAYASVLLLFVLLHLLLIGAGYLGRPALIIAGFLLFIPSLTLARLYWLLQFRKT